MDESQARIDQLEGEVQKLQATLDALQNGSLTPSEQNGVLAINQLQQENLRLRLELKQRQEEKRNRLTQTSSENPPKPQYKYDACFEDKLALYNHLCVENNKLRKQLGCQLVNYKEEENITPSIIDDIIDQLNTDNEKFRREVRENGIPTRQPYKEFEPIEKFYGKKNGCKFWAPLSNKEYEEQLKREQAALPISVKKQRISPCSKCEKAILLAGRIPPYPPNSTSIPLKGGEYEQLKAWIFTLFKGEVNINEIHKTLFFWKFQEMERNFRDIRLYVNLPVDAERLLSEGVSEAIMIARHIRYIQEKLDADGTATFLICAADIGNSAINQCPHTQLPTVQDIEEENGEFDSLIFQFHDAKAIFILKPERVLPLYSVTLNA